MLFQALVTLRYLVGGDSIDSKPLSLIVKLVQSSHQKTETKNHIQGVGFAHFIVSNLYCRFLTDQDQKYLN